MNTFSRYLGVLAFGLFSWASHSHAATETRFTVVDSSPTSWVARGLEDYTVSPALGWTFDVFRNFDNGISLSIAGPALPGTDIDLWFMDFAAPFDAEIVPGRYERFQRFPFQDPGRPGLAFGSSGRLDNAASGTFDVLEVVYGLDGEVLSFSVDFIHFGEQVQANWAIVELRYNATVVPLPAGGWLMATALSLLAGTMRRTRRPGALAY